VLVWSAAALVAALVAVLVLVRGGGDPPLGRPEPPTPGPQQDDLLAILPADFDAAGCRPAPAAGDGDVAAVDCGPSATQPGPASSRFFLYPDGATADRVFLDDVGRVDLTELVNGADCPASQGHRRWQDGRGNGGSVACYVDQENDAVLIWTETEDGAEAIVTIRHGGTQGLSELISWWADPDVTVFG
jgi:serine/threonine-protein kinase